MTVQKKTARPRTVRPTTDHDQRSFATYWLTRNTVDGRLSDLVDVWLLRPSRERLPNGDSLWGVTRPDGSSAHHGRWTVDMAYHEVRGGLPENDRQCLRCGPLSDIAEAVA